MALKAAAERMFLAKRPRPALLDVRGRLGTQRIARPLVAGTAGPVLPSRVGQPIDRREKRRKLDYFQDRLTDDL